MDPASGRAVPVAEGRDVLGTADRHRPGATTPAELMDEILGRPLDDHSFIRITADQARYDAAEATRRWRSRRPIGPLDGLPVVIKDCIDVAGVPTTNGSLVAGSAAPAGDDAGIVRLLRQQGAVVVGKTNQSELAFTGLGMNPHFGSPANPLFTGPSRVTGGSSSGSAVAVAAGHAALGVGTDTSGSVRVPAAFCGVVGYKASEGWFPMDGVRPLCPSLDSLGLLTRTVADLRIALRALRPNPARGSRSAGPPYVFVVPDDEIVSACEAGVRAWFGRQVDELASIDGVTVEVRRLPVLAEAQRLMDQQGTLVASDAFRLYGHHLVEPGAEHLDPHVRRRLQAASSLGPGIEVVRRSRPVLRQRLEHELADGLLLCPTVRHRPPLISEVTTSAAAFNDINARTLRTTMLLSYLGMPGVSVPRGTGGTEGLGMLVSAPWGQDARVVDAAAVLSGSEEAQDSGLWPALATKPW
jgi:aspartyl-tRNA(Asn)/glutamyl-tRNA(Gln) amidotransferase subunit A